MRVAEAIELDAKTERALRTLAQGRRVEARVKQRASVVLLAARGWQNKDIAEEVRLDRRQVAVWRKRFIEGGLEAAYRRELDAAPDRDKLRQEIEDRLYEVLGRPATCPHGFPIPDESGERVPQLASLDETRPLPALPALARTGLTPAAHFGAATTPL